MKDKNLKRKEALERLSNSVWKNSKAKRLGTKTQNQWAAWKDQEATKLLISQNWLRR